MNHKKLKPEYQELADDFAKFEDEYGGCSCHINPPCSYCTHEGHPENLANSEDAWESRVESAMRVDA